MCDPEKADFSQNSPGPQPGFTLAGDPRGHTLAVLHGWAADSAFTAALGSLFPEYRVMLIDLPGYGKSRALAGSVGHFAEQVRLLCGIIPEGAALMCWSLSSLYGIAMCAASRRIRALITVCGSPRFPEGESYPGLPARIIGKLRHSFTKDRASHLVKLFYAGQRRGLCGERIASCFENFTMPPYEVLREGIEIMAERDERKIFSRLRLPVLLIYGALDQLVPVSQQDFLARPPRCASLILRHSGHMPFLSEPEKFASAVRSFLAGLSA
ncbi:MAG: alpha/beta fold hydrolase [Succinivibrio sp.]|nr:alpha/beta fold hydrolase [Succinivibrio sp.]